MAERPVVLIVMDGVGMPESGYGNAVAAAYTPTLDYLRENHAFTKIKAHGTAVGLPSDEDMGNSEVGHNAIGCGQIYAQGAKLVNKSIESGGMFASEIWRELMENCRETGTLHFIGLLSDGNVHSHIRHLIAMLGRAKVEAVRRVRVHALLDGRDVPPTSAPLYIAELEAELDRLRGDTFDCKIASGGGRMNITMDRYGADWEMVRRGWETHVRGVGRQFPKAAAAIEAYRREATGGELFDQDCPPFVIAENGAPVGTIQDGDSVILFNFRGDRAIEISRVFEDEDFDKFERGTRPNVKFAGMLEYDGDLGIPKKFLVAPPEIRETLSEVLVSAGIKQFAVSETQKYGHVTYFWNGNKTGKFSEELEDYLEIPSDIVPFDQRPWMKAAEVTDAVVAAVKSRKYGFIRANYPNGDMVGHTGNYRAAVIAVEAVDLQLQRVLEAAMDENCCLIVTADHGNADEMYEKVGAGEAPKPKTSHTLSAVPFIVFDAEKRHEFLEGSFGLANIAATVCGLMNIEPPGSWEKGML